METSLYLAFNPYGGKKEKSVAETTNTEDQPKDPIPGKQPPRSKLNNMLKNPLFWPSVCLVTILSVITSGFFLNINISWPGIWDAVTNEKTWASLTVGVGGVMGIALLVNEKLKNMREKTEATNERVGLVEKTTEVISRATYDIQKFIDDIQEENKKYWQQLNETQEQLQEVRDHYNASQNQIITLERQITELLGQSRQDKDKIANLEIQIAVLQAQSIADKQTIATLQAEVISLRGEIARTQDENNRLHEENRDLRNLYGRRYTDKLGQLPPEAEARFNELQQNQGEK